MRKQSCWHWGSVVAILHLVVSTYYVIATLIVRTMPFRTHLGDHFLPSRVLRHKPLLQQDPAQLDHGSHAAQFLRLKYRHIHTQTAGTARKTH